MGVTLREVFTPLLTHVVLFTRTPSQQQRSFADVRADIERLLEEQKVLVKRHDVPMQDYETARFAVVAWVDELLLQCTYASNREFAQQWKRAPLQVELYNTANAGEDFFQKLEALQPAQKDIREIYHLCVCLGFHGRYYDDAQTYKLIELRRQIAQHLPITVPDLLELEKKQERITPQPYAAKAVAPPRRRGTGALGWTALALAIAAACVAVILYLVWPAAQRPQAEIVADVKQRLAPFTCWHLDAIDFQPQKGVVTLAGRVESGEQRQQIQQAVKGVPEVTTVQDSFTVIPRPFCEVLELLAPFETHAKEAGVDLAVRLQKGCDTAYHRGESMVFGVSAQKPLQYVYVDYFVADRTQTAHLMPSPQQPDNLLKTSTALTLGDASSDTHWQVEPPFGMELISVISSPKALFGQPRPAVEGVSAYLGDLQHVLSGGTAGGEVNAAHCLITTEDR